MIDSVDKLLGLVQLPTEGERRILLITEADFSATTFLLPEEY